MNGCFQGSTLLSRVAVLVPSTIPPILQMLVARQAGVRLRIQGVFILMYVVGDVGGSPPPQKKRFVVRENKLRTLKQNRRLSCVL